MPKVNEHSKEKQKFIKVIHDFGGPRKFAKALGVSQTIVYWWMNGRKNATSLISAKYCLEIEKLTMGSITKEELRPDIFYPSKSKLTLSLSSRQKVDQAIMLVTKTFNELLEQLSSPKPKKGK